MKIVRNLSKFKVLFCCGLFSAGAFAAPGSEAAILKAIWDASLPDRPLRAWSLDDLSRLSPASSRQKDPSSGRMVSWKGVLISKWIEKALSELPLEQRSQVDLVILKNEKGEQAIIPRYVAQDFPLLLAWEKDRKKLAEGELTVVVPAEAKNHVARENLPFAAYRLEGVREIHLSSYQARFNAFLLKRRTDPAAIRGEKMVVQNCVSCHASGRAKALSNFTVTPGDLPQQVSAGHVQKSGAPQLNGRDLRAFLSYLTAFRQENQLSAPETSQKPQARK